MVIVTVELGKADGELAGLDSPAAVAISVGLLWSGLTVTVTVFGGSGWVSPDCTPPACTVFVTVFVVAFFSVIEESGFPTLPLITVSVFTGGSG